MEEMNRRRLTEIDIEKYRKMMAATRPKDSPSVHLKAAGIHRFIAISYVLLLVIIATVMREEVWKNPGFLFFPFIFIILHFAIYRGAKRASKTAKIFSIVLGILMLFGFPIGTILGALILKNSLPDWQQYS